MGFYKWYSGHRQISNISRTKSQAWNVSRRFAVAFVQYIEAMC